MKYRIHVLTSSSGVFSSWGVSSLSTCASAFTCSCAAFAFPATLSLVALQV